MGSRIIKQVKNILEKREIPYEQNYITFEHKGTQYQVFRVNKVGQKVYRLNIGKGNKWTSEDYSHQRINEMFSKLIRCLDEVVEDDD